MMDRSEQRRELLGLLERDYQGTRELMRSANGSVDRTRTFGFALVAALIGFAASDHILWAGLLAALASGLLAYLDGFHSWQYEAAVKHARRIERIHQLLYKAHTAAFNERDKRSLTVRAASFRPGVLTGQGRFTPRDLRYCLPIPILVLYPLLALAGIGIGAYESTRGATETVNARVVSGAAGTKTAAASLSVLLREEMSGQERGELAKLGAKMRRSADPGERQLGSFIDMLLNASPGLISTIVPALAHDGTGLERQAGALLAKALGGALLSGASIQSTVNDNHPQFTLNAPSFVFNAEGSSNSKPTGHKSSKQREPDTERHRKGGGQRPPSNHGEGPGEMKTLPYTP
jgi:hypothetical protein